MAGAAAESTEPHVKQQSTARVIVSNRNNIASHFLLPNPVVRTPEGRPVTFDLILYELRVVGS